MPSSNEEKNIDSYVVLLSGMNTHRKLRDIIAEPKSTLAKADLRHLLASDTTFTGVDFSGADLANAKLYNCTFKSCIFDKTTLTFCTAENVTFENCIIRHSVFDKSSLNLCCFYGTVIEHTSFRKSDLTNARFMSIKAHGVWKDDYCSPSKAVYEPLIMSGDWGRLLLKTKNEGRCTFQGGHGALKNCDFSDACLHKSQFCGSRTIVYFRQAKVSAFHLFASHPHLVQVFMLIGIHEISNCSFRDADLTNSKFGFSFDEDLREQQSILHQIESETAEAQRNVKHTQFEWCGDRTAPRFGPARIPLLRHCCFIGADLRNANFNYVDLRESVIGTEKITDCSFEHVFYSEATAFPKNYAITGTAKKVRKAWLGLWLPDRSTK